MVKLDRIPQEAIKKPERPWFRLGEEPKFLTGKREDAIRWYAQLEGYTTLRGYWEHMRKEEWDYYDIIRMASP